MTVGANQEISALAGPNARRIDLRGRAVIPGLIDNHMHLLRATTTWLRELRVDGVESQKQAVEMLRARVKAAGAGEWVYNIGGWAHQQFADDSRRSRARNWIASRRRIRLPCRSLTTRSF